MKRFCPTILRIAKDEEEAAPMVALRLRKRGKMAIGMMLYKKMVNFDGCEIDPKDILDVTEQKKETKQYNDLSDALKKDTINKLKERNIDVVPEDNMDFNQYNYYEFVEQTDTVGEGYKLEVVVVNENDFLNQSSDSYDPEDSNDENNPNNSYPSTPSSEYADDGDDEFFGDYVISAGEESEGDDDKMEED